MISVIIPTFNSEKVIAKCLTSLQKQNFKGKYEIIVVDDESKDNTAKIASKFKGVKVFKRPHRGPAVQRNFGVKKSKGDIVLFVNDDNVADKNWLKRMIEPFKDLEVAGVSGTCRTENNESLLARYVGYDIEYRHEEMKRKKYIDFIGTFSAAYRKSVFLKVGGFDETFTQPTGEDPELSFRIAKKHKLVFQPKAVVGAYHWDTIKKFYRKKFYRTYWRIMMYKKHPKKMLGDSYTPAKSLLSMVIQILAVGIMPIALILSIFFKPQIIFSIPLLLVFLLAQNAPFSFWVWKKDRPVAIASYFYVLVRSIAFFLGIIVGLFEYMTGRMTKSAKR